MVLLSHVVHKHAQNTPVEAQFLDWFTFGGYGVDIFFVISGFIIPYVLAGESGTLPHSVSFMMRRIIRIYPLYWLVTLLALGIWLVKPEVVNSSAPHLTRIWESFVLFPTDGRYLVQTGWSLAYEMYVYGLFALAMLCGSWKRYVFMAVLLVSFMAGVAVTPPQENWMQYFLFRHHFAEFLLGFLICLYAKGLIGRIPRAGMALLAAGTVILFAQALAGNGVTFWLQYWGFAAAALVLGALMLENRVRWPKRLLALGDESYSLYLIHPFTVAAVAKVIYKLPLSPIVANVVYSLVAIAASVILAKLTYRFFEVPVTRGLNRAWREQVKGWEAAPRRETVGILKGR
jgi:peptidoglycan/LPS O-acetylase OafA/YrhL